jgi:hypothetical protein
VVAPLPHTTAGRSDNLDYEKRLEEVRKSPASIRLALPPQHFFHPVEAAR